MREFYGYDKAKDVFPATVVAIGVFDGIHLGHQFLLKKLFNSSPGTPKIILTFDPHPGVVMPRKNSSERIMSLEHRLNIFRKMGIDATIIQDFSDGFAKMPPEVFVSEVLNSINAIEVFVGADFRFGSGRSGDAELLKKIGASQNININIIENKVVEGGPVSSTRIRELVTSGRLADARSLLGRPVSILGTVTSGRKKGRQLGFPTANIDPHQEVIPPMGVYAVKAEIGDTLYNGVLNIGFNPTFFSENGSQRKEPTIELHLIDFKRHLYNQNIEIYFMKRLRDEKRYSSEKRLKKQIEADIERSKKILSRFSPEEEIIVFEGISSK